MAGRSNKVRVGFFSFTEVTDPRGHRAYNEWHMLDHMPEQFPITGVVHGQRWVLTPQRRLDAIVTEPFERVHYVTLYLIGDPVDATLDEFVALGAQLRTTPGRWFADRRAAVSGPWDLGALAVSPRIPIRMEAVAARPHRGVHVVVGDGPSPDSFAACDGVIGAWRFDAAPRLASRRRGHVEESITIVWLEDLDARLPSPPPDLRLSATFETIVPYEWDWFEDVPPASAY